jgi:GT2 family glycosyltransferase
MAASFAISVPIGGYHGLLRDCLRSLAAQSPRPQIAALDASNDPRVSAILDEFSNIITYRRTGPDEGQSDAIIEGWENLDGDILGWLNVDDALYPGALAAVVKHYDENPDTDVFYGHTVIIDDDQAIKGFHWAVEPPSDEILLGGIISQPSCFFRRSLVDAVGGLDRDLHYTMDWDLWIRFWRAGGKFRFSDQVYSRVLWSSDAKTGGFGEKRRRELDRLISQHTSLTRRTKSRIGFALHHAFEYMLPSQLARAIRERSARHSRAIHGINRAGGIGAAARLPLVHFDDDEKMRLIVTLKGANGRLRIGANGAEIEAAGPGSHTLLFEKPALAAETVVVEMDNLGAVPVYLLKAEWG